MKIRHGFLLLVKAMMTVWHYTIVGADITHIADLRIHRSLNC